MPSLFPVSLDTLNNPTGTTALNDVNFLHADQHANANNAIEAIESTIGITGSTDPLSLEYRLNAKVPIGGALGTPTSGDLRNCSLAVAPAIGGTTPAAGAFTTLSASGAGINSKHQSMTGAGTGFELKTYSGDASAQNAMAYRIKLDYLDGVALNSYIDFYRGLGGGDGFLKLGASGADVATVSSTGLAVTGAISASGLEHKFGSNTAGQTTTIAFPAYRDVDVNHKGAYIKTVSTSAGTHDTTVVETWVSGGAATGHDPAKITEVNYVGLAVTGTITSTVPAAGAFTTLSASGAIIAVDVALTKFAGGEVFSISSTGGTPYGRITDGTYTLTYGIDSTNPSSVSAFLNGTNGLRVLCNGSLIGAFSATGLAVTGTLTSTVPAAGAFTTLSATGDVSISGAAGTRTLTVQSNTSGNASLTLLAAGDNSAELAYVRGSSLLRATMGANKWELIDGTGLAVTGAITSTVPAAGAFTTLSASGDAIFGGSDVSHNVIVRGVGSGTNGGSSLLVGLVGTTIIGIGNKSAILGGAYDATPTIYANAPITTTQNLEVTGTITSTVPAAGAFTTLSASGVVTATAGISVGLNGSIAVPAIARYGESTGVYFGSNTVNISAGNVGVGSWSSTGLAVTGTLSATGSFVLSSTVVPDANIAWIGPNSSTTHWFINTPTGSSTTIGVNNVAVAVTTATGLAVTGTIKGSTTIGVGNATPAASGAGITFPATQSASSDPNTLDDYEEGTWTPALTFATPGTLAITYAVQSGVYTKIGRSVSVEFYIVIGTNNFTKGTASGQMSITGLPFTSNAQTPSNLYFDFACNATDFTASTLVIANLSTGSTSFFCEKTVVSGTLIRRAEATLDASDFAASNTNGAIALGVKMSYNT